jgi:hypothetical protein
MEGVANPKIKQGLEQSLTSSVTADPDDNPLSASMIWSDSFDLSGGAATLDLTGLLRGVLTSLTLLGKKPLCIVIYNKATNTSSVTIVPGAVNGFDVFGAADSKVTLPVGHFVMIGAANLAGVVAALQTVATGDKTIDFSSSDANATVQVGVIASLTV